MRLWLIALLLLPMAQAAPGVAVLVYHPFPDDADPLGIDQGGRDPFVQRHGRFDANGDGFDFPVFVADGLTYIEGLPEGDPQQATTGAYLSAVADRQQAPVGIRMESRAINFDGQLRIVVNFTADADFSQENLQAWLAVVEHPVRYQPPTALSNGVFDHPFTVRHVENLGTVDLPHQLRELVPWNPSWNEDALYVAVWLEQAGPGSKLDAGEVAQSVFHKLGDDVTATEGRTVLVEAYSASWCDPCLFGDRALEAVADAYGVATTESTNAEVTYWRSPPVWIWPVVAAAGLAFLLVRLPEDE